MVSIIMGVYNGEKVGLERSIESILCQTYSDFEFIICDDGSVDETWAILTHYSRYDNRIKLLKNEQNLGHAFALNRCINASKCELLIRNDADDYSDSNRIEQLLLFLNQNSNYSIVGSNVRLFDVTGLWGEMRYKCTPQVEDMLFCLPYAHGALALIKSHVLQVGGYNISKKTRLCEDFDLISRMYNAGFSGYNLQSSLYNYYCDVNKKKAKRLKDRFDEAAVKYIAFTSLKLPPKRIIYCIKPIVVGFIPNKLLNKLKDKYYQRRIK